MCVLLGKQWHVVAMLKPIAKKSTYMSSKSMWVQVLVHLVNHRTNIAFNTFTVTHSIQTYY